MPTVEYLGEITGGWNTLSESFIDFRAFTCVDLHLSLFIIKDEGAD